MKNLLLLSLVLIIGMSFVSCKKEELIVEPVETKDSTVVFEEWEDGGTIERDIYL